MIARKEDGVGWLIFNNPARRNAVSMAMWEAVGEAMEDFQADDDIRVVVMAGAATRLSFRALIFRSSPKTVTPPPRKKNTTPPRPGRTGACDRYGNTDGALARLDPFVVTQRVVEKEGAPRCVFFCVMNA